MIYIMYPSDYFEKDSVEPEYREEYKAAKEIFKNNILLFDYDRFIDKQDLCIRGNLVGEGICLYRGWMLKPEQYAILYKKMLDKNISLINSPREYNNCHLFPLVQHSLAKSTPKCLSFKTGEIIDWELINLSFDKFIMKDYVKSVKGYNFPTYFQTPVSPDYMQKQIDDFRAYRGDDFTEGLVIKEYIELKQYSGLSNEYRAFFLFGNLLTLTANSGQHSSTARVSMDYCMSFNFLPSNYYTVDFAECADGSWIIIETGDGQVSGLSDKEAILDYYSNMYNLFKHKNL